MAINFQVNNLTKIPINGKFARDVVGTVINGEMGSLADLREIEVSVVSVGPAKIREINKKYRKKDQVTDILSFAEAEEECFKPGMSGYPKVLGELVICANQVKKDAREARVKFKEQLAWVLVHGTLHLFDYDHETCEADAQKMRNREKFYLSKINFKSEKQKTQSVKQK